MRESTEITNTELQEMARIILCEIYGGRTLQKGRDEPDFSESAGRTVSRGEGAYAEFDRRSESPKDEGDIQRKPSGFGELAEFYPRLNRGEFLEQRIGRRKQRHAQYGSFENASAQAEKYLVKSSDNLAALDLSEKLSDNFCRDVRRYDGAFERY